MAAAKYRNLDGLYSDFNAKFKNKIKNRSTYLKYQIWPPVVLKIFYCSS